MVEIKYKQMRKIIVTFTLVLSAFLANAQEISKNAIGIRFGSNNGFGGEVSYQRKMSSNNRLEINLGIRGDENYSSFKAAGLYQWVFSLPELDKNINWYVGAGGGLGSWNIKEKKIKGVNIGGKSSIFLFGAGVVGIEYNFNIPLHISLDFRPEMGFGDTYKGFHSDIGLGVRYKF